MYKYFNKYEFKPMLDLNTSNDILHNIKSNDVALHIRRTDYTNNNFHKVLSINYYYNALKELSTKVELNKIYVFSDDMRWCKENVTYKNVSIEHVNLKSEIEEFIFMHTFDNIIMANSSFSWWAAYLRMLKIFIPLIIGSPRDVI